MFLRDTAASNELQVQYIVDMNMNSVRLEGIFGSSHQLYDMFDKYGLLVLVGWSCQWEWSEYFGASTHSTYGGITSTRNINLVAKYFEEQIIWLRNHPSILVWLVGSDMIPHPTLEEMYVEILPKIDTPEYISSAQMERSTISGYSGFKMYGPYELYGPNYWSTDTRNGGNYGFNSETGIGANIPVYESLIRFIPQDRLWPLSAEWNYHTTQSGGEMNTMNVLLDSITRRYGPPTSLVDFLMKADLTNYDGTSDV